MALNPPEVAELTQLVKTMLENWMRLKLAMQKAFSKGPLSREHETAFLKLKSELSRLYRQVGNRLPKDLQFEGDDMMEMMKNATTLEHLHALPLNEKRNVFAKWHRIYVLLTRTYGALEVIDEGYYPRLHRDLMKSVDISKKKKKKRSPSKTK